MRAWVTYHALTSLEDFLMWELDTLQYDAIRVYFPSRDTTQPNSLVSLKPNSIGHLIMLRKYIHHPVVMPSWEPQCHHDIIMRTPRITGKPRFSCSSGP